MKNRAFLVLAALVTMPLFLQPTEAGTRKSVRDVHFDDCGDQTKRIKLPDLEEIRKMPPAGIELKREQRP